MLTFALERELIEMHPLLCFRMLKEERPALRVMTLREERRLIESIDERTGIAAYAAALGETGLRKREGLLLKWERLSLDQRILSASIHEKLEATICSRFGFRRIVVAVARSRRRLSVCFCSARVTRPMAKA
jgi:integrase